MPEIVTPEGTSDLKSQPWSVGFYGPFRVLTQLEDIEQEIDIDDRAAILNIIIEMMPTNELDLVARNVVVTLYFNFAEELADDDSVLKERDNILFNGLERGPLVLIGGPGDAGPAEIIPGEPYETQVTINTGLFSSLGTPRDAGPATPGRKIVDVRIDYDLEPRNPTDQPNRTNAPATMLFVVGKD